MATAIKSDATEVVQVTPEAILERMKYANSNISGKIPDKRMSAIVRSAMKALAEEVVSHEEGSLRVPGLGRITIRQIDTERNGTSVTLKRILLNPIDPNA